MRGRSRKRRNVASVSSITSSTRGGRTRSMASRSEQCVLTWVTAIEPPLLGSAVAQAQAMGRPVVTSDIGMLPEHVLVPPRMPEELRTGWVVAPADAIGLAHTLKLALELAPTDYQAMAARAREFAEYMFSPESAAAATRAVYMSLLARDL